MNCGENRKDPSMYINVALSMHQNTGFQILLYFCPHAASYSYSYRYVHQVVVVAKKICHHEAAEK